LALDSPADSLPGSLGGGNRTGETGASRGWFRRHAIKALGILAILAGGAAAWYTLRGGEQKVVDARGPSVIVLPFEASGDGDVGLIASGITQELITGLLRFPDFRLYSASASFRQDQTAAAVDLGRQLGVAYVVSGSVQSSADQLRLRSQLADAKTGEILWSGSYDRALAPADLINLQSELASAIATELGEPYGVVSHNAASRLTRGDAPGMPSYACILRAYDYRRTFQDDLFAPTLACLKQAVVRDPDYADAWAMLGWLHLDAVRQDIAPAAERPAEMAAAFDAASHAVDLDRKSLRALEALSAVTFFQGDYAAAEALQREALALNPHDPDTLAQLGWRLAVRGDREGLDYLEQAVTRSANPPGWYYHLIAVHAFLDGDYARALAAAEKSSKHGSAVGLSIAAMSHAKLGDTEMARAELAAMAEAWPLLWRDPAAAYRMHHPTDAIVEGLVEGLREAGWTPPEDASH
jgi:TolB-like protein